jgi:HK97 family phage major capsid protein
MDDHDFAAWRERVHGEWEPRALGECTARRSDIGERLATLSGYSNLSRSQRDEADQLNGEALFLDELISDKSVEIRRAQLAHIADLAKNPANRESGDGGHAPGAPAIVHGLGDRHERPGEILQRMGGNPWRAADGAPLSLAGDSTDGYVSRAQSALEGMEGRLTHDGAEKLSAMLSARPSPVGWYEQRTAEDIRRSAEFILAASNPFYESAMRHVFRDPMAFRMGTGHLRWSDDERMAFGAVELSRTALFESASGAYILPLALDPTVILVNAGSANPWRRICKTVQTSSNTWNGATSAGTTAHWYAEGVISSDDTPTLTQKQITPHMEEAFIQASFEQIADSAFADQIPMMVGDAFSRLESAAFALGAGDGSNAPWGAVTRATVDGSTGTVNAAAAVSVLSLITNLPPRFRLGGAKPTFLANIAIINIMRQTTAFTAATQAIVDDSTPTPTCFGIPVEEASDLDASNAAGGHKNLVLMDANSFLIAERLGTSILFEPMLAGTGGIIPNRTSGWLAWRRVGSDVADATAVRVHNNA